LDIMRALQKSLETNVEEKGIEGDASARLCIQRI
jgi:hypothetical protein